MMLYYVKPNACSKIQKVFKWNDKNVAFISQRLTRSIDLEITVKREESPPINTLSREEMNVALTRGWAIHAEKRHSFEQFL